MNRMNRIGAFTFSAMAVGFLVAVVVGWLR